MVRDSFKAWAAACCLVVGGVILGNAPAHAQGNDSGASFSSAKKVLQKQVYYDHRTTFYAACSFDAKKHVDWASCGYAPRARAKRGGRVEWEHVMPAWEFGHQLQCWQQGGRKACKKDPRFRRMESDMHNLRPAVGELNGDRSNYRYGMIEGEARAYGAVDFEVDFKHRVAEPRPEVRGDIARTYFYMAREYGIRISSKQRKLFEAWDRADPVDAWERERNRRITRLQGNFNAMIERGAPGKPTIASVEMVRRTHAVREKRAD